MDVITPNEHISSQNSNDKNVEILNLSELASTEGEDEAAEEEYSQKLKERFLSLRATMQDLKKQLKEEKDNWRKEIENIKLFEVKSTETIADDPLQGFNFSAFDQKHRFEDALNNAHKESRANLQRQIAISNYKRRLLEVENMCNMELLRVKQNVQFLQPLQLMASEWNYSKEPTNEAGDMLYEKTDSSMTSIETSASEESKPKEVSMPLEMISSRLYSDMNDMFSKLSAQCNESMPLLSSGNWSNDNQMPQSRSTIWYNENIAAKQNQ